MTKSTTKSCQVIYYFKDKLGNLISSNIFTKKPSEQRIKNVVNIRHGNQTTDNSTFNFKVVN